MRTVRVVLCLSGAALFILLLARIGTEAIVSAFTGLSWRLLVILVFPFSLVTVFDTLGWWFAFRGPRPPYRALLLARLAGEAFNATTPTASVGGEPVKAWLLRPAVPLSQSVPSVVVAKTTITISQALFLLVGLLAAPALLPADSVLLRAMQWLLALEVAGVAGFIVVQVVGVAAAWRVVERLGLEVGRGRGAMGEAADSLAAFYRTERVRLALSIACHFLGWVFSALEAYVVLHALGLPVSLTTALVIEAFGTGVRFASFMVPAHLGALEGGHVLTFVALGLGAPSGLAFTLVRRLREAFWIALGFVVLPALGAPARPRAVVEVDG